MDVLFSSKLIDTIIIQYKNSNGTVLLIISPMPPNLTLTGLNIEEDLYFFIFSILRSYTGNHDTHTFPITTLPFRWNKISRRPKMAAPDQIPPAMCLLSVGDVLYSIRHSLSLSLSLSLCSSLADPGTGKQVLLPEPVQWPCHSFSREDS